MDLIKVVKFKKCDGKMLKFLTSLIALKVLSSEKDPAEIRLM